ncbi:MAG: 3-oxoacyl-[acyl-carrier-protein] synthase III C-terminal domain-containing protein [Polyangiales bacterium]|nr:hypothetical protein [Myxococcales bacterium]MCB9658147.1 hypothetical protein [Sandaracinaceae bacterium]
MGLYIHSTGLSSVDATVDSISHSAAAARACLEQAGLAVGDVDFLVNVGVFRHHNMCEPSVCALIQHALEMSPDIRKFPGTREVFSFDLNNGACGLLNAVTVLRAMLTTRRKEYALIVAADCPPSGQPDPTFPITPLGSAMLLRLAPGDRGFGAVQQRTSPVAFDGQTGSCDIAVRGTKSRTTIDVVRAPDYLERLQAFARETANAFLDETGAQRSALRLICSEPSETFGAQLAEGLGLHPGALLSTWKTHADTHTSACTLGWHLARERQPLSDGERVLFVNAGGGLTVGCALYEHVAR